MQPHCTPGPSHDISTTQTTTVMTTTAARGNSNWLSVRIASNDQRGGDRWTSCGVRGIWHRWHMPPRLSLFTPYKVSKGPGSRCCLHQHRSTYGVTSAGRSFDFDDDWTKPESTMARVHSIYRKRRRVHNNSRDLRGRQVRRRHRRALRAGRRLED